MSQLEKDPFWQSTQDNEDKISDEKIDNWLEPEKFNEEFISNLIKDMEEIVKTDLQGEDKKYLEEKINRAQQLKDDLNKLDDDSYDHARKEVYLITKQLEKIKQAEK